MGKKLYPFFSIFHLCLSSSYTPSKDSKNFETLHPHHSKFKPKGKKGFCIYIYINWCEKEIMIYQSMKSKRLSTFKIYMQKIITN